MDLPTPDDTSRAEDHADPGHEGGPSFFDLGCLSNLAVLIGVFLYGCIFGCEQINLGWTVGHGGGLGGPPIPPPTAFEGGVNAVVWLFLWVYILPILPVVVWIAGAVAYKGYKNQPFMNEGPKTLALFLILAVTAMLATLCRFIAVGEGVTAVDNLLLLILAALVILYPVSWCTGGTRNEASAEEARTAMAKHAAVQRGAGKGKFFLDEDE